VIHKTLINFCFPLFLSLSLFSQQIFLSTNLTSLPCTPGKAGDATGCKNCIAGQYQTATTQTICLDCDEGKASSEGSAVCQICAGGKYVSTKGSNVCFECPQGWKRAELDPPTSCYQCDMGEKASSEGSATCQLCAAGKYVSTKGSSSCFECPQGWKRAELDSPTTCKQCQIGRTTESNNGSTSCSLCNFGQYGSAPGHCTQCPSSNFTDSKGLLKCKACINGEVNKINSIW
jgi:hypothetical protein